MMRSLRLSAAVAIAAGCGAYPSYQRGVSAPRSVLADERGGPGAEESTGEVATVTVAEAASPPSMLYRLGGAPPPPPPRADVLPSPEAKAPEKLVIEAWIDMSTDDVGKTAAAVRARVEADGGRVISENLIGSEKAASSGAMELRVPPEKAQDFLTWLASQGDVDSRRIMATDVSKRLFDQALALENLELTSTRLQKLLERDVPMADVLAIEKELTRVRGEIEAIKGEQRYLLDRVQFATVQLTMQRKGGPAVFAPHAKFHPGLHFSTLSLLDPGGRDRTRAGGGFTLHVLRGYTLDLDVYPARGAESRTVTVTTGGGLYSDYLGSGDRRWLNPYLGLRAGYGFLGDESKLLAGGEVGVEVLKVKFLLVEGTARVLAFIDGDGADVALALSFGAVVPF